MPWFPITDSALIPMRIINDNFIFTLTVMPLLLLGYLDENPLLKHLVAELNDALVVVRDIRKHASLLLLLL